MHLPLNYLYQSTCQEAEYSGRTPQTGSQLVFSALPPQNTPAVIQWDCTFKQITSLPGKRWSYPNSSNSKFFTIVSSLYKFSHCLLYSKLYLQSFRIALPDFLNQNCPVFVYCLCIQHVCQINCNSPNNKDNKRSSSHKFSMDAFNKNYQLWFSIRPGLPVFSGYWS